MFTANNKMKGTKIEIRKATKADLPFIMETERKPDNSSYVLQWSEETHLNSIVDSNLTYFVFEEINTKKPIGFCILRGLDDSSRNIELKRIAVNEKGKGFGREALKLMKKIAFEQLKGHRLWLDVMEHNVRAKTLYESEGFKEEGKLRDCLFQNNRYVSLFIHSILEDEYFACKDACVD